LVIGCQHSRAAQVHPGLTSWVILSRPCGTCLGGNVHPGLASCATLSRPLRQAQGRLCGTGSDAPRWLICSSASAYQTRIAEPGGDSPAATRLRNSGTSGPSTLLLTELSVECCVSHSSPKQGLNGAPNVRCRWRQQGHGSSDSRRESTARGDKFVGGGAPRHVWRWMDRVKHCVCGFQ
jgi:hypothetical protein